MVSLHRNSLVKYRQEFTCQDCCVVAEQHYQIGHIRFVILWLCPVQQSILLSSGYRGKITKELCGISNLKIGMSCAIPDTVNWSIAEFSTEVAKWQDRMSTFESYLSSEETLSRLHRINVYYEDLQVDLEGTIKVPATKCLNTFNS